MEEKTVKRENLILHEEFLSVSKRVHYNQFIGEFYERFAEENQMPIRVQDDKVIYGNDPNFIRRGKRIKECCRDWTFDFFKKSGYKNLIRVNRCTDRFCLNCQAMAANQRFMQYSPILDSFTKDYDLYHIVLTVPNVDAERLADTVTLMLDRFSYMIRYFDGRKNVRNVDFSKYGYVGAVRSLEITVSKKNGSYHPHLHCIFVLKKNLDMPKIYWNSFSDDKTGRTESRLFSEFELLIQRIWCLLILRKEVTKRNIENIGAICDYPDGFSCMADLSNGAYHEIFKYAIKGSFKNETLFKYEAFKTLYSALFNRKVYQTYGCLQMYDFNDYDESLGMDAKDAAFELFLAGLLKEELPERIEEILATILKHTFDGTYKYISKATYSRHFRVLSEEDKQEVLEKLAKTMGE